MFLNSLLHVSVLQHLYLVTQLRRFLLVVLLQIQRCCQREMVRGIYLFLHYRRPLERKDTFF
jgi:hypothetical protein